MERYVEVQIFPKVAKSLEAVSSAVSVLDALLGEKAAFNSSEYYKARNYIKDAEALFQEAIKSAKKLLGPLPEYASPDFMKWRSEMLDKNKVLVKSKEFENLKSELSADPFMQQWMSEQEIAAFLEEHFQTQQEGKRKLPNIKVRMALDILQKRISHAKKMQKEAFSRQYSGN